MTRVFERLGYQIALERPTTWDVMWSHEYPFGTSPVKMHLSNLRDDQRINKMPGSGFVTSKVELASSTDLDEYVPKAFKLPGQKDSFLTYAKAHPDAMWVQKSNKHRGIKILPVDQLDMTASGTFLQRYVDRPLLVDGRKFDIGVYTMVTSLEPLRVYIYWNDMLYRFCSARTSRTARQCV